MTTNPKAALTWQAIRVGDELPVFDLPLTASVIVAGALASRDFMPVHHDRAFAVAQGAPDIFMNILTTNGYVSRYVTDWAGPEAMLQKISIRLGVPALPGTTMRFTGSVLRTERAANGGHKGNHKGDPKDGHKDGHKGNDELGVVEVELRGTTDIGDHVTGTVLLTLPLAGGEG
jgi:acyl dehydratase